MNPKIFFLNFIKILFSDFSKIIISFFTIILITKILTVAEYGVYGIILSYSSIISIIGLNSSNNKIIINTISKFKTIDKLFFKNVLIIRIISILLGIIIFLIVNSVFKLNFGSYYYILFFLVTGIVIWDFSETFSFGKLKFNYSVVLNFSSNFIFLLILFFFKNELNFFKVIVIYTSIYFVYIKSKVINEIKKHFDYKIPNILKNSYPYLIIRFLAGLVEHSPVIFLSIFLTEIESAYFNLSNRLIFPFLIFMSAIVRITYPYLSRLVEIRSIEVLSSFKKYYSIFFLFLAIIIFFINTSSNFWIQIIFGDEYLNSIKIFKILSWVVLFYAFDIILSNLFSSLNKQHILYKITIIDCLIIIPLIIIGSFKGGDTVALLKLFGYFLTFIIHFYFLKRYLKLKFFNKKSIINFSLSLCLIITTFFIINKYIFVIGITISILFLIINKNDLSIIYDKIKISL